MVFLFFFFFNHNWHANSQHADETKRKKKEEENAHSTTQQAKSKMERSIVGTRYIEIKNRVSQADRKRNREDILEQKLACDLRARSRRGQGFVDGVCARFMEDTVIFG